MHAFLQPLPKQIASVLQPLPPCSQTDSAACLGEGCNALNHIVQVMCMQVLKKVGTHLQGGSQELEIVKCWSVKLH